MDPISLLLLAKTSYEAVKSAVAAGKEIQGVAKDLGSLFDSVAHITRIAAEPPRASLLSGKTAEQMAMEAYAAKAEADQLMADLKNHFVGEYGLSAWDEVVAATTRIKKDIKAAEIQAANEQAELMDNLASWAVGIILVLTVVAILSLLAIAIAHR
jgi:cobalamin biosynthesis protein CbiG